MRAFLFQVERTDLAIQKLDVFVHFLIQPFQPAAAAMPTSLTGWMANAAQMPHPAVSGAPLGSLATPPSAGCCLIPFFLLFKKIYSSNSSL